MLSKYIGVATVIFLTPIRFFGPGHPEQMDLTQETTSLDTAGLTYEEYLKDKCKHGSVTLIQDLRANRVHTIQFEPNASGSDIIYDGENKGPTICLSVEDFREFLIRSESGDGSSFIKLLGHVITKTKDGVVEIMWGDSNTGDSGAKYEQNFILEFFEGKSNVTNTKVNTENSVAKQRGSELVLIDVTFLQLGSADEKEFIFAVAKHYESNFWIKFKTISLTVWITTVAAVSIIKFQSYTQREKAMDHWKSRVFLVLELVDQAKDLVFLYSKRHSLWMSIAFSLTMILPFILNIQATNVVEFRVNKPGKIQHDEPKEVKEVELLTKTARTNFGCEKKEDGKADADFAQRRYEAGKITKLGENVGQMLCILYETFQNDYTISFLTMFNLMFGLLMSTLTFAEHAGHKFAAKHPYIFKDQLAVIAADQDGLTEHEKDCQRYIRDNVVAKVIQQIDDLGPQEWRQYNHVGLDKLFVEQINSVIFSKVTDEKQLKKLLFNKSYEDFTLAQRIQNGLVEMFPTIGLTLFLFTLILYINLEPRSSVQELEDKGLIDNISKLEDSVFPFVAINDNMATIVATLFALPVIVYAFTQFKQQKAMKTSPLKTPLFGDESESKSGIEPSQQVSDKSILIQFTKGNRKLHSSPLVVKDTIHKITVSSQWVFGKILLILERDGKEIASQDLFGKFDLSFNQTDTVLTSESDIVKQAQPGDHYFLKAIDYPYILSLRLELLGKEEEAKGLFVYKCPKAHQLKVFHPYDRRTNTQWKELTRAKNEHGCGHERKMKTNGNYGDAICQYFCDDCAESYCGDCAFKHRVANEDFN